MNTLPLIIESMESKECSCKWCHDNQALRKKTVTYTFVCIVCGCSVVVRSVKQSQLLKKSVQ